MGQSIIGNGGGGAINSLQGSRGASIDISTADVDISGGGLLFIGTGGDLKVDLKDSGTGITFKNLADGSFFPLWVTKVYSTGSTATDLITIE